MKLSKTQVALLERAYGSRFGRVATIHGYITSRKRRAYGYREANAATGLMEAGLLAQVSSHSSTVHLCHGFGSDHGSEVIWAITEEGRKAAKANGLCGAKENG